MSGAARPGELRRADESGYIHTGIARASGDVKVCTVTGHGTIVRAFVNIVARVGDSVRQVSLIGHRSPRVCTPPKNAESSPRQHDWALKRSTHFSAFDQNIFTEYHSRYGRRGVLIYWSVEKGSVVIHSQLLNCSASEVHAMVDGAIHHGTEMAVEANYVDTHGQSEIGFGVTKLLGFDLLPRIKRINKVKMYRPAAGEPDLWPQLKPALTRPINWTKIAEQYDQMLKYATAIRTGTASTEAILRRFMKANAAHPTYQAMIELGRAQKTVFLARYLRSRGLQREINDGLNVIESWNRCNSIIFYGKSSELASNRRDEQEMSVLCLRICQAAIVYINVLMIQDVLADPDWDGVLTVEDERGLTPLFWSHVLPYGEVKLNMSSRLTLGGA